MDLRLIFALFIAAVASTMAVNDEPDLEADYPTDNFHFERIITNENDTISGVPVDYTYNETATNNGALGSSPGCPKSDAGYPWVYYGTEAKFRCYLTGTRGPCSVGQKLSVEKGNLFGFCACDCFTRIKDDKGEIQLCSAIIQTKDGYLTERDVVFHPGIKKCYILYEKGSCKDNEWIVVDPSLSKSSDLKLELSPLKCEERKCPADHIPSYDDNGNFHCATVFSVQFKIVSFGANDCNDNYKYSSLLKKCVPNFNYFYVG